MNKLTRRAFIITGVAVGGGLIIGVGGLNYMNKKIKEYPIDGLGEGTSMNAWITIRKDNTIVFAIPRAEMGQGVYTALPMLIAEELEVDLDQVEVVHPQLASPYTNLMGERGAADEKLKFMSKLMYFMAAVATGGSTSVMDGYDQMRIAGATARDMLLRAGAEKMGVAASDCVAKSGFIIHKGSQKKLSYGEIAENAIQLKPKQKPKLKEPSQFKIIGKAHPRLDLPEKVTGAAKFGIDTRLKGMLYAAIKHPEILGSRIVKIKNEDRIRAMKGVREVLLLENSAAVVADNSWRAMNAAKMLDLELDNLDYANLNSAQIKKELRQMISGEIPHIKEEKGDAIQILNTEENVLQAEYFVPYLAHACMEPMNTTVLVKDGKAEVWSGNQSPLFVVEAVNSGTGVSKKDIKIHIPYLGGGFGRRAEKDFVFQAAQIAKKVEGTPVQLLWSREEDMRNDTYRPASLSQFRAKVNANGEIEAYENNMALQSALIGLMGRNVVSFMVPSKAADESSTEGAVELPYKIKNMRVGYDIADYPIQVGTWRSVGHSQNGFFKESFMDEMAHSIKNDPYQFRRNLLKSGSREVKVLDKLAEISNWNTAPSEGIYRGIALHKSFKSIVAQVVELRKIDDKTFHLDKVYCVIDCGQTVNPDTIEAQMESGINFAFSAALFGEISFDQGEAQQYNFPQYEMVRMKEAPEIEVFIMKNTERPSGVGEPGVPPFAAALANAIFSATGTRYRTLPLKNEGIKFV